jgi:uncharacterized protein (TIGR01244 family)
MTDKIKSVSPNFSSDAQISADDLQAAAQQGFKSVLNLRSPNESGFLADEQQLAEAAGLKYANVPLNPTEANAEQVSSALEALKDLPQPTLIHCAAGARAGAIALIADATREGLTPEQVIARAQEVGLSQEQPHLNHFIQTLQQKD